MSVPTDSKYRLPTEPTKMLITPQIAGDWLDHRNTPLKNRYLSKHIATKYANAMRRGEWRLTAQNLSFDTEGWVLDGQHRLWAVALCGIAQEFWVFPDEPRDTFALYDTGHKRGAAQLLRVPHRNVLAGSVRYLAVADGLYPPRAEKGAIAELSNVQTLDLVRFYGTTLEEAVREAAGTKNHAKVPASPHAAVLYQALSGEYADRVDEYLRGVNTGAELTANDPRLRLRNVFLAAAGVRAAATRTLAMPYGLSAKAWNAYIEGKPVGSLVWKQGLEEVPKVIGYTPKSSK